MAVRQFVEQPAAAEMSDHMLRGHLRFLHGAYTEPSLTRSSMEACHRARHADPDPPYDLDHAHGGS